VEGHVLCFTLQVNKVPEILLTLVQSQVGIQNNFHGLLLIIDEVRYDNKLNEL